MKDYTPKEWVKNNLVTKKKLEELKKLIEDLPAGGNGEFAVHITGTEVEDEIVCESDKTISEIYEAKQNGLTPVAYLSVDGEPPFMLWCARCNEISVIFVLTLGTDAFVLIGAVEDETQYWGLLESSCDIPEPDSASNGELLGSDGDKYVFLPNPKPLIVDMTLSGLTGTINSPTVEEIVSAFNNNKRVLIPVNVGNGEIKFELMECTYTDASHYRFKFYTFTYSSSSNEVDLYYLDFQNSLTTTCVIKTFTPDSVVPNANGTFVEYTYGSGTATAQGNIYCYKQQNLVTINANITALGTNFTNAIGSIIATIPSGFRPKYNVIAVGSELLNNEHQGDGITLTQISTTGEITVLHATEETYNGLVFNATYEVDDE